MLTAVITMTLIAPIVYPLWIRREMEMPLNGEAKREYNRRYRKDVREDEEKWKRYKERQRLRYHRSKLKDINGPIAILVGRTVIIRF